MKMKMIYNMYRYRDVRLLSKGLLAYAIEDLEHKGNTGIPDPRYS
jgi:hypothetical protein